MDIREEQVTSECGTLRLRRQGQGAPLLFLHGSQGMNGWPDYLERLAQHHEVIAPDLPGFGRSDTSQRVGTVSDTTRVLLDLIDTLGLAAPGSLHLAGHCIGGWAAMELAVRSTAIASLTLVNAAGVHVDGVHKGDFFIASPEEYPALMFADEAAGRAYFTAEAAGQFESIMFRNRLMATRLGWSPRLFDRALMRWLPRIKARTQVIWGADNRVLPPAYGSGLAAMLKATLTSIPKAGHFAQIEQAQICAEATLGFTGR